MELKLFDFLPPLEEFYSGIDANVKREIVGRFVVDSLKNIIKRLYSSKDDGISTKTFENSTEQIQSHLDFIWEKLNIGCWKDVSLSWRFLYSFFSLLKASYFLLFNKVDEAIKSCDLGLLMGAPIFDGLLSILASAASELAEGEPFCKRIKMDHNDSSTDKHELVKFSLVNLDQPSLMEFYEFFKTKKPVLLKNSVQHWKAFDRWSVEYLVAIAGKRTVPVEIGSRYTEESWTQKLITLSEFIELYILKSDGVGYLAQHELFNQIPELKDDIVIPDYCCLHLGEENTSEDIEINAWFGPKGTVSPLHHDPKHNLLVQVLGSKYVRLYEEKHSSSVYPYPTKLLCNTSQVDVENPDFEKFPDFEGAPYFECILKPGDTLYIPPKCWHYVKSLSISFSVSFWWQ